MWLLPVVVTEGAHIVMEIAGHYDQLSYFFFSNIFYWFFL